MKSVTSQIRSPSSMRVTTTFVSLRYICRRRGASRFVSIAK